MASDYPKTTFSSYNQPRENGGAVYAIWREIARGDMRCAGYLSKTRHGTWQVEIASRYYGPRNNETARFADAKQMARDLLA